MYKKYKKAPFLMSIFFFKSHTFLRKETYVQHTAVMLLWLKQKHKHFSNKDSARKPYMN